MMAFLIKLLFFLLRMIPVRLLGGLGAGLGRIAFYLDARHRQIAMRNLTRIYPDQSEAWKKRICRESFAELGRTTFELPHVYLRSKDFLLSRIDVKNHQALLDAEAQHKGVILTACHHSNWELGALAMSMLGHHAEIIYRTVRQPAIDAFVLQARSRFDASLRPRDRGLRWIPRALKQNHCISVMIDQHLSNGTPVSFWGHQARTTTMPAILSNKYHAPVVGVTLKRIGRTFRFQLEFTNLPTADDKHDEIATMQIICDSFLPMIHQRPELWLWIHRRWLYLDEKETDKKETNKRESDNQAADQQTVDKQEQA